MNIQEEKENLNKKLETQISLLKQCIELGQLEYLDAQLVLITEISNTLGWIDGAYRDEIT